MKIDNENVNNSCASRHFGSANYANSSAYELSPLWSNSGYPGSFGDVRVYADINYVGASTCAPNGGSGNIPSEWNDRISSHKWVTNCGF
ncbi:hypothetical protein [Streptomyces sp. NBC_00576]|uniref:hypothetical protein n=1 Tax=Streptomyces sp. NBC_00576 TaxID=2903665 RepID=UPI002E800257|nr:hypothetical protein [Streptomyces sp. NBC_00576]WUB71465.1 hypothetical protein OG734_15910 [Streptomyces sp. NBC_00576]